MVVAGEDCLRHRPPKKRGRRITGTSGSVTRIASRWAYLRSVWRIARSKASKSHDRMKRESGIIGMCGCEGGGTMLGRQGVVAALTVSVTGVVSLSVAEVGETAQFGPAVTTGETVQLKVAVPVVPGVPITFKVKFAAWPALMVCEIG